ncbi:MAG: hypothetical protein DMG90_14350 [Acidobacteria bacterium]|nr:MAG: hypothetical protein DMG90_14350 [Acidobacteriota bacterium]
MHGLGHEANQAFVNAHSQFADGFGIQADGSGQNQIGAIRFKQVNRTYIRVEAVRDKSDHVCQHFRWLTAFGCKAADFLPA